MISLQAQATMFVKDQPQLKDTMKAVGITTPGVSPLRSGDWLVFRPDDGRGKYAKWGCPACADVYKPARDNQNRIVAFGINNGSKTSSFDPECCRIGKISKQAENEMTQLKGSQC